MEGAGWVSDPFLQNGLYHCAITTTCPLESAMGQMMKTPLLRGIVYELKARFGAE